MSRVLRLIVQPSTVESDHGKLKRLINPVLGFKSKHTAYATIKGFEVMRIFRKGRDGLMVLWSYGLMVLWSYGLMVLWSYGITV